MLLIPRYLRQVLRPQLAGLRVSPQLQDLICADVERRLQSLLGNWHDQEFRRTALLPAMELAVFYEPAEAPLEIRALVAAAIRNSMLEELNTDRPYHPAFVGAGCRLLDQVVPVITGQAIEFFANHWQEHTQVLPPEDGDLFRALAKTCPSAWRRLEMLATSRELEIVLQPEELVPASFEECEAPTELQQTVVASGFAPTFDPQLQQMLSGLRRGEAECFFTPVFKMLSRNAEKVLHVMNMVLSWQRSFVTCHYMITPDYCARREGFICTPHTTGDVLQALGETGGLSRRHADVLQSIQQQAKLPFNW